MDSDKELGLTIGDLRKQVMRLEKISYEDLADDETSREFSRLDIHVRHMVQIQIVQELNEIKHALVTIAETQTQQIKATVDKMPYIH